MGTISSQVQSEDVDSGNPSHTIQTELKIDFSKEVNPNLKQLLYCYIFLYIYKNNVFLRVFGRNKGSIREIQTKVKYSIH